MQEPKIIRLLATVADKIAYDPTHSDNTVLGYIREAAEAFRDIESSLGNDLTDRFSDNDLKPLEELVESYQPTFSNAIRLEWEEAFESELNALLKTAITKMEKDDVLSSKIEESSREEATALLKNIIRSPFE